MRNDELKDRGEADAGFGAKAARLGVERDEAVKSGQVDDRAGPVQAGVAVRPPQAGRKFAFPLRRRDQTRKLVAEIRMGDILLLADDPSPRKHVVALDEQPLLSL